MPTQAPVQSPTPVPTQPSVQPSPPVRTSGLPTTLDLSALTPEDIQAILAIANRQRVDPLAELRASQPLPVPNTQAAAPSSTAFVPAQPVTQALIQVPTPSGTLQASLPSGGSLTTIQESRADDSEDEDDPDNTKEPSAEATMQTSPERSPTHRDAPSTPINQSTSSTTATPGFAAASLSDVPTPEFDGTQPPLYLDAALGTATRPSGTPSILKTLGTPPPTTPDGDGFIPVPSKKKRTKQHRGNDNMCSNLSNLFSPSNTQDDSASVSTSLDDSPTRTHDPTNVPSPDATTGQGSRNVRNRTVKGTKKDTSTSRKPPPPGDSGGAADGKKDF